MNTEPTVLGSLVHNPPTAPLAGGAIGEGAHLPEREEIELKPCKGFPRRLCIDWGPSRTSVHLRTRDHQWLAESRVRHAEVSLMAHDITTLQSQKIVYCLYLGDATFQVSQREFETLAAKLEPRGVKVTKP